MTHPQRILVVDDEPILLRLLQRALQANGYGVAVAGDGREALAQLDAGPVDLVISDVRMPGMDGPGLLAELRLRPAPPPLVFLTGYADHTHAELRKLGALDVYEKPVHADMVLEIVRKNLPARD